MTGIIHIVLARKPISEATITENCLKHGTGALNIDGCRIECNSRPNVVADRGRMTGNSWQGGLDGSLCGSKAEGETLQGRFPANVIFGHAGGCRCVGAKKVKSVRHWIAPTKSELYDLGIKDSGRNEGNKLVEDGKEEVESWECVEGCPVKELDEQSGITKSGAMKREVSSYQGNSITSFLRGRSGPSRFFKVVKELEL